MTDLAGIEFQLLDMLALGWFLLIWWGFAAYADYMYNRTSNLLRVTDTYRLAWMREMLKRENRMMDATMLGNLLRSITFFANTSTFILLSLITLLGFGDRAIKIISAIPFSAPYTPFLWEVKAFLLIVIFVYAFFKFTWSIRQYNYACLYVAGAPPATDNSLDIETYAQKGAKLIGNAGRHFNMGLRAYYFGMAALSWLINPWLFIISTALVAFVLYRREFRSHTLNNLISHLEL